MNTTLHFMHPSTLVSPESQMYKLPSYPPPDDWVVTTDQNGNDLSRYGDGYWNYSAFGYHGFNFDEHQLSNRNLRLVKHVLLLVIYHPQLFPGTIASCVNHFRMLVKIAEVCDKHNVLLSDLSRFPQLYSHIADALQCSRFVIYIGYLHKFLLYRSEIGFVIGDRKTLSYLTSRVEHQEFIQHPYIPPRIWSYQVNRLNEFLEDFIKHQHLIANLYNWLTKTHQHNSDLEMEPYLWSPFSHKNIGHKDRITYNGSFINILEEYNLFSLIQRWQGSERFESKRGIRPSVFSDYLNSARNLAVLYILNFSLQRSSEAVSLRADCFVTEHDERLGKICMIVGETTKTDPDSDARWVVPAQVEKAIKVSTQIAKLRMLNRPESASIDNDIKDNPYLMTPAWDPWVPITSKKPKVKSLDFGSFISRNLPRLFDLKEITITDEDWKVALSLTPNLGQKKGFGIGLPWRFSAHQLRRTTNVNMFASSIVTDSSLQWAMKHLARQMTLYYGRNHSNLRLNSSAETAVILESYRAIYRQLVEIVEDSMEYVRPHAKDMIPKNVIELVGARDEKILLNLIKRGSVGCRPTLLGYCVKVGACEYGGIESVAKCAGSDGKNICAEAIFERKNKAKLIRLKDNHEQELGTLTRGSPRYSALKQEIYAIEVYFNVINS